MSRFLISTLREGPEELRRQLPIRGETVEIRIGPDGLTYFSAQLDEPVLHRLDPSTVTTALPAEHLGADDSGPSLLVSDIVMRPSRPGESPHYGMQRFPVDIAYVLDLSYRSDQAVDFTKLQPIAAVDIDDLPDDAQPTPHPDNQVAVAPPAEATDQVGEEIPDAEPASDDLPDDASPPAPGDFDLDGDHPTPVDPDGLPDDGPFTPHAAIPSGLPPSLPAATAEPEQPTQTDQEPALVEPVDEDRDADALPDPRPSVSASVPAPIGAPRDGGEVIRPVLTATTARPSAAAPRDGGEVTGPVRTARTARPSAAAPRDGGEVTGPVRTATTARPPGSPQAVDSDTAGRSQQPFGPPPASPVHSHPSATTPTATPSQPLRHVGPPLRTSDRPDDARSARPAPTRPEPPRHGMLPPPVIPTTPRRQMPSAKVLTVAAAVLVGLVLVSVAIWNVAGSDSDSDQAVTTQPTTPSEEALQRLKSALPKGYSEDSCTIPDDDYSWRSLQAYGNAADAAVICGPNTDPGGPPTATYTLYADKQALTKAFTDTIATLDRAICPGNIQSPGPWRRNAAPTQVAGTLFCGTDRGQAVVAWTSDAQSLLNVTEAGAQGPSLEQLYAWWTTHS